LQKQKKFRTIFANWKISTFNQTFVLRLKSAKILDRNTIRKSKFGSKTKNLVKNQKFGQRSKCWPKIKNSVENQKFGKKIKILVKNPKFGQNQKFGQKSKIG